MDRSYLAGTWRFVGSSGSGHRVCFGVWVVERGVAGGGERERERDIERERDTHV